MSDSVKIRFNQSYPVKTALATVKADITFADLKKEAAKALERKDLLEEYTWRSVDFGHDIVSLDPLGATDKVTIKEGTTIFALAPASMLPSRKRHEEKKEEDTGDSDEKYKGLDKEKILVQFSKFPPKKKAIAWEFIEMHAEEIVKSKSFLDAPAELVAAFCKKDRLNIPEVALFEAVVAWGKKKIKETKVEDNKDNLKKVLADILPHIRFTLMTTEGIATKVNTTGVLTDTQVLELYTYIASKDTGAKIPAGLKGFDSKARDPREERDTTWMLTSDSYGGFRPLPSPSGVTRFWLCVSNVNRYEAGKKYDPPKGYEWALTDMFHSGTVLSSSSEYNYYSLGGWSGYTFNGVERHCFIFKDSADSKRMLHAGNYATMSGLQTWDPVAPSSGYNFAGIVVIKKGSWDTSSRTFKA